MNPWILAVIALYLTSMVIIGLICSRKTKNVNDYFLGGRRLGPIVTAMSAEASDMSGWLLMGLPGVALACGLAEAFWTAIGLGIGTYINWLVVAKRLRIYSQKLDAITVPEFFRKRFGDDAGFLSLFAALVIIIFFIPYTASGFNACGTLFSALSGGEISYLNAMLVSAAVIVLYTVLGGFLAASLTDLIQSIIMTVALITVIFFSIRFAGGWDKVVENAASLPSYLKLTSTYDYTSGQAVPFGGLTIASTMAWGLGYFGMPHILLRFMAVKDAEKLKVSRRVGTTWVLIAMGIAIVIGVIGNAIVANGTVVLDAKDGQRILVEISKKMSELGILPTIIGGLILSGILASTMSTSDSQLLAAASSVSNDLLVNVLHLKLSEKARIWFSRLAIVVISVIACVWARKEGTVFTIVSFAWAGFGASFGPVMLCALFWKRTNKWGALAGMLTGGAFVFIWKYLIARLGGLFAIYELLPAFILGLIACIVVSLLTEKPSEEQTKLFDEVKASL